MWSVFIQSLDVYWLWKMYLGLCSTLGLGGLGSIGIDASCPEAADILAGETDFWEDFETLK
jgi:hypothetical protein